MSYPRFTLRDLLWFMAVAAATAAWWGDSYAQSITAKRNMERVLERHREEMRVQNAVRLKLTEALAERGYNVLIAVDQVSVYPVQSMSSPPRSRNPAGGER
jgi:hypothetical protein